MSVELVGSDKLMARIATLRERSLDSAAEAGCVKTAESVRDLAQTLCPVGTPESTGKKWYIGGSLKTSIRVRLIKNPVKNLHTVTVSAGGFVINPNTRKVVDYAQRVEFGTSKMAPQPFMSPSFRAHTQLAVRNIKDAIVPV